MRTRVLIAVSLLLVGAACSGDDEPTATPEDSPAPPASSPVEDTPSPPPSEPDEPGTGCSNEADVLGEAMTSDRMLEGDVDGDGEADRVVLVVDRSAEEERCRAFIVVESSSISHVAAIEQEGMSFDVGFPALVSLAQIDGEPGLDIVLNMIAGASTQFAGVYTAHEQMPERLTFSQPTEFGDLFPTGGSVGHLEASDCVGPGAIVITTATPQGDDYRVTRTAYVVVDGQLTGQEEGASTRRISIDDLETYPEFAASPFGSCPTD